MEWKVEYLYMSVFNNTGEKVPLRDTSIRCGNVCSISLRKEFAKLFSKWKSSIIILHKRIMGNKKDRNNSHKWCFMPLQDYVIDLPMCSDVPSFFGARK